MHAARPTLPPTSDELLAAEARPYFLWWTDATVAELRRRLASDDAHERAYWVGAILREANTRDVWLFVTPDEVRALWPRLLRHLGHTRSRWAWLLGLPEPEWPPAEARHG
ncbi:MAG: hypothetical protein JXB32_21880 [Deltaproteobacteria bacterium]|nr:hypothetical protein [Deltaproteobacteria bacterium]